MATVYPTQKDSWLEQAHEQPVFAGHFVNLQDAIAALESKVGIDNSGVGTSLDYQVNYLIDSTNYLYFYENTAPTGWTASVLAGDMVLGVVASSGAYDVAGGNIVGGWDLVSDMGDDTHNHNWMYYSGNLNYTYDSAGDPVQYGTPYVGIGKRAPGFLAYLHSKNTSDPYDTNQSLYNLSCYTNTDNHSHGFGTGWRPDAAVGVIAYYTGP